MQIQHILFDLDGTLLPMNQEEFVTFYMPLWAKKYLSEGIQFDPKAFIASIWKGYEAMVKNDGSCTNREAFWKYMDELLPTDQENSEKIALDFYGNEFNQAIVVTKPNQLTDKIVKKAKEKGIRITYIDSYTKEELQDLTVATDNVNAGRMLGEYARKLIDKDSKIAIVSHVKGVSTAVEREQGFREGLGDYADNIVDIVYCNSLYEKSYELAQELMRKYPDLELIAGMNEYSAVGVGRAVSDAGAKDKIAVVGVDCSQEAINLMEMGVYKGIIVQKAFRMGYIGVEETIHMLNGDAVEKNIDSGCELVTPENMYNSDIERLIFPFS